MIFKAPYNQEHSMIPYIYVCMGMGTCIYTHARMYHTWGRCLKKSPDKNNKYGANMSNNERNHAAGYTINLQMMCCI